MDLLCKSYPSIVLCSPPLRYTSLCNIQSRLLRSLLYIIYRGKRSRAGGCAAGAASQQGDIYYRALVGRVL